MQNHTFYGLRQWFFGGISSEWYNEYPGINYPAKRLTTGIEASKQNHRPENRMRELQVAIRQKCFECATGEFVEVVNCNTRDCPIFHVRPTEDFGTEEEMQEAIRLNCIDCIGDSPGRVRGCPSIACPFHKYRIGIRKHYAAGSKKTNNSTQTLNHDPSE
jgi:hypothetical protein